MTKVIDFLLCVIAIILGVIIVILSITKQIDLYAASLFLGISVCCLGVSVMDYQTPIEAIRKRRKTRR